MSRSIRDNLKRKTAQAMNHLAQAVLDVYEVQQEFAEHHKDYAEGLEAITLAIAEQREALIMFGLAAWALDEESILRFQ